MIGNIYERYNRATNSRFALPHTHLAFPKLRPEQELMLLCSAISADEVRIQRLIRSGVDWETCLVAASRNRVLGLLSKNLQAHGAGEVPESTLDFLRDCSRRIAERSLYLARELKRICARFRDSGIRAFPFGGPLLAGVYRDPSLREIKNLEFIVDPEHILRARDLLIADGYRRDYTWDSAREAAELRFRRTIGLDRSEDGVHIWLSCDLDSGSYSQRLPLADLMLSSISVDGEVVATLNAEDALMHACVHATSDAFAFAPPLVLISDAARIAGNLRVDSWRRFMARVAAVGVKRRVSVILMLARDLAGASYPETIQSEIEQSSAVPALCEHIIARIFAGRDYVPPARKRTALQLAARERWLDKVWILIRFAVVPTRDDWAILPLPASLYFAIRPLRMLARRIGLLRQRRLAVFMPTPIEIVEEMLRLAEVRQSDTVYDLGCGDGRIVIHAARQYGARGVGVDLDSDRVAEAKTNAQAAGVQHLVTFLQQSAMDVDISKASVVSLFLSPQANLMLRPRLMRELSPNARIVSRSHDMGDWTPATTKLVACDGALSKIQLWRIGNKNGEAIENLS